MATPANKEYDFMYKILLIGDRFLINLLFTDINKWCRKEYALIFYLRQEITLTKVAYCYDSRTTIGPIRTFQQ